MLHFQHTVNEIDEGPAYLNHRVPSNRMSCTMEKILSDARLLVNRLKDHDVSADGLINHSQTLYKKVDAMKQYQDDINELNEIARHRPRANLIMGLLQENNQIRELQQENKDLRLSLEEHQSALELIMSKYREQVVKLVSANRLASSTPSESDQSEVVQEKIDKICEMAAVMQRAVQMDEAHVANEQQEATRLKLENKTLRELLRISTMNQAHAYQIITAEGQTQTEDSSKSEVDDDDDLDDNTWADSFHSQDLNGTIIRARKSSDKKDENSPKSSESAGNQNEAAGLNKDSVELDGDAKDLLGSKDMDDSANSSLDSSASDDSQDSQVLK